jgi:hypothetical protein
MPARAAHQLHSYRASSLQRTRSNPSGVRGPVLVPPCIRHLPFGIAGDRHGDAFRVFAPQRGEAWANGKVVRQSGRRCIGFFPCFICWSFPRLTGRDITDNGLTARLHCDVLHPDNLTATLTALSIKRRDHLHHSAREAGTVFPKPCRRVLWLFWNHGPPEALHCSEVHGDGLRIIPSISSFGSKDATARSAIEQRSCRCSAVIPDGHQHAEATEFKRTAVNKWDREPAAHRRLSGPSGSRSFESLILMMTGLSDCGFDLLLIVVISCGPLWDG